MPPVDLARRVSDYLGAWLDGRKLAVGVSGGPDSMALVHLLRDLPGLTAITVDHGLRPESSNEAAFVARVMADWGVAHRILRWQDEKPASNVQAAARDARYRLLRQCCKDLDIDLLALAHHGDDQIETLLMRIERGSGVDGLAAIPREQYIRADNEVYAEAVIHGGITIVRPLLDVPKADILSYVAANTIPHVTDPSNSDLRYQRVKTRALLEDLHSDGVLEKRLLQTVHHMQEARVALDWASANLVRSGFVDVAGGVGYFEPAALDGVPSEIVRRVLAAFCQRWSQARYKPRLESLAGLVDQLAEPDATATLAGVIFLRDQGRLWIGREAAAMPRCPLDRKITCFDRIWSVDMAGPLVGHHLAALGEDGWQQLCALAGDAPWRALPHVLRRSLPALWREDRLIGVPLAQGRDAATNLPIRLIGETNPYAGTVYP